MAHIVLHPTCFALQRAAYIISLRFNDERISYAFSGAFEVMLMSEIKEDSMIDHVEIVIEAEHAELAQLLFKECTQPLHVWRNYNLVNVCNGPKANIMVKLITAGENFYPPFSSKNLVSGQDLKISNQYLHVRSPLGELVAVPVIDPKYLLCQRLASFYHMDESEIQNKQDILFQINICLATAARTAQNSIPEIGKCSKVQAPRLREYVRHLISFASEYGRAVTRDQIEQWRIVGVPMIYEDLIPPCQLGN